MRRMILRVPAALFLCFWPARAGDPTVASRVAGIAQTERKLPWFWSPSAEGLADVPYTYEEQISRRILSRGGKELPPNPQTDGITNWHSVRLERIPLEFGAFLRCLSQDGVTPCSKEWDQELERQVKRRDELSPEARARIDQTREERRMRRRTFWDRFPAAMEFELTSADQIRFSTKTKSCQTLLDAMKGRLWFDAATNEITQMEYDLMRDVDDVLLKRPKGTHFRIELTKAGDEHYLPLRISSRQRRGKSGELEETTAEFANFRRFGSESSIKFGDTDLPIKK